MKNRIINLIEKGIQQGVFPGAVLLAAHEGRRFFHESIGNRAVLPRHVPMKKETIFDLASLTKPLATTLAMMGLVDDGRVGLDVPLIDLLPLSPLEEKATLTPRLLLCHSAGLVDWKPYYLNLVDHPIEDRKGILRHWIIREPFAYPPREGSLYSDLGFMLLEWVIEEKAGESLPRLVDRKFYGPLGLKKTFFSASALFPSARKGENPPRPPFAKGGREGVCFGKAGREGEGFAKGGGKEGTKGGESGEEGGIQTTSEALDLRFYGSDEERLERGNKHYSKEEFAATEDCPWRKEIIQGVVHDENACAVGGYSGHAGLFGTAEEAYVLVNLLREHYQGTRDDYLKPATVRKFFKRQNIAKVSTWALGWDTPSAEDSSSGRYFSENSVGHLGYTGTSVWMDLEKDVIVILLTNRVHPTRNNERIKAFRPKLHDAVMEELGMGSA